MCALSRQRKPGSFGRKIEFGDVTRNSREESSGAGIQVGMVHSRGRACNGNHWPDVVFSQLLKKNGVQHFFNASIHRGIKGVHCGWIHRIFWSRGALLLTHHTYTFLMYSGFYSMGAIACSVCPLDELDVDDFINSPAIQDLHSSFLRRF